LLNIKKREMKLVKNKQVEESEVVIPKVRLMYDRILTTIFADKVLPSGLIATSNELGMVHTKQMVVAVGPNGVAQVGQYIEINFDAFHVKNSPPKNDIGPYIKNVMMPVEVINGERYLFISSREVKWLYPVEAEIGEE